mmetsp:Transcript_3694/g.8036  ORF Transcript_3694/g.8036 Transcript_3694/m.8036 type:complete len:262 (+) Transcript_3694:226-1011(+)
MTEFHLCPQINEAGLRNKLGRWLCGRRRRWPRGNLRLFRFLWRFRLLGCRGGFTFCWLSRGRSGGLSTGSRRCHRWNWRCRPWSLISITSRIKIESRSAAASTSASATLIVRSSPLHRRGWRAAATVTRSRGSAILLILILILMGWQRRLIGMLRVRSSRLLSAVAVSAAVTRSGRSLVTIVVTVLRRGGGGRIIPILLSGRAVTMLVPSRWAVVSVAAVSTSWRGTIASVRARGRTRRRAVVAAKIIVSVVFSIWRRWSS